MRYFVVFCLVLALSVPVITSGRRRARKSKRPPPCSLRVSDGIMDTDFDERQLEEMELVLEGWHPGLKDGDGGKISQVQQNFLAFVFLMRRLAKESATREFIDENFLERISHKYIVLENGAARMPYLTWSANRVFEASAEAAYRVSSRRSTTISALRSMYYQKCRVRSRGKAGLFDEDGDLAIDATTHPTGGTADWRNFPALEMIFDFLESLELGEKKLPPIEVLKERPPTYTLHVMVRTLTFEEVQEIRRRLNLAPLKESDRPRNIVAAR
ncbi:MAG TPA: hypothetical protein VEA59_02270 [Patescibacteria group bacterium]|nr:hypothetical protein [Patescibacteria group bacterium]